MKDKKEDNLDIVKSVNEIRELVESKDADTAEVKAKIEAATKDASEKMETINADILAVKQENKELKAAQDKFKADYDDLYKKANRLGVGAVSEEAEELKNHSTAMINYLRKGVEPDSDALNEIAFYMAEKASGSKDDAEVKKVAESLIRENESNAGHLMFNLKAMAAGVNPDGGYFTGVDQRTDISVTRVFETSPMRALANTITTSEGSVDILIDDDENDTGGWVGEVTAPSDTDNAQVGKLEIHAHEIYAQPKATRKLLEDSSINIEAWLAQKTSRKFTREENTAFVSGDGSQKPKGFLSYDAWAVNGTYERNKLEQINSGVSGVVKADGIISLQNALVEEYQSGSSFLMKRATWGDVLKLKDANGAYLLNIELLANGAPPLLLGKPVFFANDMQAVAADALAIAYGDFNTGYTIVDRMGIFVIRDNLTDKPNTKFYTTKRVGGAVTNYQSIKIQKLAA